MTLQGVALGSRVQRRTQNGYCQVHRHTAARALSQMTEHRWKATVWLAPLMDPESPGTPPPLPTAATSGKQVWLTQECRLIILSALTRQAKVQREARTGALLSGLGHGDVPAQRQDSCLAAEHFLGLSALLKVRGYARHLCLGGFSITL